MSLRTAPGPRPGESPVGRDLVYLVVLAALAALPLVVLRYHELARSGPFLAALVLAGVTVSRVWLRGAPGVPAAPAPGRPATGVRRRNAAVVVGTLLAVTVLAFLGPAALQFWSGYDESLCFDPRHQVVWNERTDTSCGRPLSTVIPCLITSLGGSRVESYLVVGAALVLANGVLVCAIVRRSLPRGEGVALAAGVLLVCHRGDPMSFFVCWPGSGYWPGVLSLLLGVWVLLVSYDRGSRGLLLLACAGLAVSLLIHEAAFPLAPVALVLLWLRRRPEADWRVWAFAWVATTGVLAARVVQFLLTPGEANYQQRILGDNPVFDAGVLGRILDFLRPGLTYFAPCPYPPVGLIPGSVVLAAVAVAVWRVSRNDQPGAGIRALVVGLAITGCGSVLGVAPFVPLRDVSRSQFYAAPLEAAFLALGLALVCGRLRHPRGRVLFTAAVAALAGHATASSYYRQLAADRHHCYEKTAFVFKQLHALAPDVRRDVLIVAFVEEGMEPAFRLNYVAAHLSRIVVGPVFVQADSRDPLHNITILSDRVRVPPKLTGAPPGTPGVVEYPLDRIVGVRIGRDGTVFVLTALPAGWPVSPEPAVRYDPLALLRPGPVAPLGIFDYPFWFPQPSDVVELHAGVLLGRGWSDPGRDGDAFFRRAEAGAEVVVNSLGRAAREVALEIEPDPEFAAVPCRLVACDEQGREVADARVTGRQVVRLFLPCPPDRAGLFRFRLEAVGVPGGMSFRAFCLPGGPPMCVHVPPAPDITEEGLRIGRGWYPLERFAGETFRWVNTDAVIYTPGLSGVEPRRILLTVEPGPGMGGRPCRMRLVDSAGRTVASADASRREEVSFPLPAGFPRGQPLKLCVDGGGHPSPRDPRELNVRVFRCRQGP